MLQLKSSVSVALTIASFVFSMGAAADFSQPTNLDDRNYGDYNDGFDGGYGRDDWRHHRPRPGRPHRCLKRNTPSNNFYDCCSGTLIYWQSGLRNYCYWQGQSGSGGGEFNAGQVGSSVCILPPPEYGITANQWVCR